MSTYPNTPDSQNLTVAAAQFATVKGDVAKNLDSIQALAKRAKTAGASLVVYPELCTTGYDAAERFTELAEPRDGDTFQQMAALAESLELAVCYGYAERDGNTVYNAAQVIDHQGKSLQHHRKTQLYGAYERQWFRAGDEPGTSVSYRGYTLSTLICYEIEFPELARLNALRGSDLILVPTAVQQQPGIDEVTQLLVKARATENNAFVIYTNHAAGPHSLHFMGRSIIAGPAATTCASSDTADTELLVTTLSRDLISQTLQVLPYLQDLRSDIL